MAVIGAVLAAGAAYFFAWVKQQSDQACSQTDGLCWTWWEWAAVPLTFTTALITLTIAYKRLDIKPLLVVVPLTILLAPLPVLAAQGTGGWWAAAVTGGAWSCSVALIARRRYRSLGVAASATLLLAFLVVLYH